MRDPVIVMTLMVRDEADIIAAMIEHHLAQGVDLIIATDNGSVDGTREILADYAETGRVEVHDYLAHDKNQSAVVSGMAARAATVHGATWVLNADADEFFLPKDRNLTLREALRHIPTGIGSFQAPVTNLTGEPARSGAAIARMIRRDERPEETLMETVALHAHPTSVAVHTGRAEVTVAQGNHAVDIPSLGSPEPAYEIEVLHIPWRTYEQYSTKIVNTGRAYDSNLTLRPSPRHHGMRDYRFWKAGVLEPMYIVRHPRDEDSADFPTDDFLASSLHALVADGGALRPAHLEPLLSEDWDGYSVAERDEAARIAALVIPLEIEHLQASTRWRDLYRGEAAGRRRAEEEAHRSKDELARVGGHPVVRAGRFAARIKRRALGVVRRVTGG